MMRFAGLSFLVISGLVLLGCGKDDESKPGKGSMPPAQVEVVTPKTIHMQETLVLPGRLQAVRSAEVRARVEGIVERRLYSEGGEVKAGEPLFEIDPKLLQANVQTAKASLMRAQADAKIAEQTSDRLAALVPQKAASQQDLDMALANLARAKADIEASKAALSRAEIDLSYAKVTAPISGRIGRAFVTEGALVGKGSATPLAMIEQMDPILVNFALSSSQYAQLRASVDAQVGQEAGKIQLNLSDKESYPLLGKLLFTDPSVDASTGSVGLRAEFSNAERRLLPGQFVSVVLPISGDKPVLSVPQKAVQASPQGQIVMTVTAEGKVAPRPIKTGSLVGGSWVVLSGLQGDEQIIVNGLQKARPGSSVTAVPAGTQPAPPTAGGK